MESLSTNRKVWRRHAGRYHRTTHLRSDRGSGRLSAAELILTDRFVELIDERMDVVVRIGVLRDSDLVMRKLADNYRIIVAAPDYLESRGTPFVPEDLSSHECLLYRSAEPHWRLVGPAGKAVELKVASRLRCNNG